MAPASIVMRLTESLVAGYNTYGFTKDGSFPEVVEGISKGDYPGREFYIGGKIIKDMSPEKHQELSHKNVTLERNTQRLISAVTAKILAT
jgi:CRISPR-associated protein Cst2